MIGASVRFSFTCLLTVIVSGCGDDSILPRGNAQPGEACGVTNDCAVGFTCRDDQCAQTDPYRISLTWQVDTDFDLHVRTPNGRQVYFGQDNEQAWIGTDDCPSEMCITPGAQHAEHAFLRAIDPPLVEFDAGNEDGGATDAAVNNTRPGKLTYEYWVDNYGCQRAGDFELAVVAADGTVEATQSGTLEARCVDSEHFTFTIE